MGNILVKVHESYRMVVAVCDSDVFGRKLVGEDNMVLDVSGKFFDGNSMSVGKAREEIMRCAAEDATFNFVGREAVDLALELGLVRDEGVLEIDSVPVALVLL